METLKDLVAAAREYKGTVLSVADRSAPYTYDDFVPNVWKAGNLLGHYGVHPGATVTVAPGPKEAGPEDEIGRIDAADPVLSVLGGTLVNATVRLTPVEPIDSRVLLAPAGWSDRFETGPSCSILAYGGPPEDPAVRHFEEEMWSENPIEPPEQVASEDPALVDESGEYSHGTLVSGAERIAEEYDLGAESTVVFDAPLSEPGAVVAGILAPVFAGAQVELTTDADTASELGAGDLLVTAADGTEESNAVNAAQVTRSLRDTRRA